MNPRFGEKNLEGLESIRTEQEAVEQPWDTESRGYGHAWRLVRSITLETWEISCGCDSGPFKHRYLSNNTSKRTVGCAPASVQSSPWLML